MSNLPVEKDLDAMVVFNLTRTHKYLSPLVDAGLRTRRMTSAQFNALLVLQSAGPEGLRMGEIGERLVVTKANVTGLVDRLERQGFVSRNHQQDRRATAVALTDDGHAILQETLPRYARLATQLTAGLSDGEKRSFVGLLTKLRRELRRQRAANDTVQKDARP